MTKQNHPHKFIQGISPRDFARYCYCRNSFFFFLALTLPLQFLFRLPQDTLADGKIHLQLHEFV